MTRRRVLERVGAVGAVLASAGCLAGRESGDTPSGGQTTTTGRRVAMGQTVTLGATEITVANPRVRKAVVTTGMAHTRVVAHAGQYVVAGVRVDGAAPEARAANLNH